MSEKTLPFPRGKTYGDSVVTLDVTTYDTAKHLEGTIHEVEDTVHGTGEKVFLRIVKNRSGAAITAARRFYRFYTGALALGRRILGVANVDGQLCKPLDDKYVVGFSIPNGDLFYVLEEGPCSVVTNAVSVSLVGGDAVATDQLGAISGAAAIAGEYVVGQIDVNCNAESAVVVIHVNRGLVNTEA